MKSYNNKKIFITVFFVTIISAYVGRQIEWQNIRVVEHNQNEAAVLYSLQNPVKQQLTFGFVGDIMLDRSVRTSVNKNFAGDYSRLFTNAQFLAQPDITFANLEGPASD